MSSSPVHLQSPHNRFFYYLLSIPSKHDAIFDRRHGVVRFIEIEQQNNTFTPIVCTCGIFEYLFREPLPRRMQTREAMEAEICRRIKQGDLLLAHVAGQTDDLGVQQRLEWCNGQHPLEFKNRNEVVFWILTEHRWPCEKKYKRSEGIAIHTAAAVTLLADSILSSKSCFSARGCGLTNTCLVL